MPSTVRQFKTHLAKSIACPQGGWEAATVEDALQKEQQKLKRDWSASNKKQGLRWTSLAA